MEGSQKPKKKEGDFQLLIPHVKGLGSHHSILTTHKNLDNSAWAYKRGEVTGQTPAIKTGETGGLVEGIMTYQSRDLGRTRGWGRKA